MSLELVELMVIFSFEMSSQSQRSGVRKLIFKKLIFRQLLRQ